MESDNDEVLVPTETAMNGKGKAKVPVIIDPETEEDEE